MSGVNGVIIENNGATELLLDKVIKKYKANYLMTGHHADDLMETILMRIVRGSTLKGYSGFSELVDMGNYKIVRPLISATKQELEDFDKENNIPYRIDKSNFKDKLFSSILLLFPKNSYFCLNSMVLIKQK